MLSDKAHGLDGLTGAFYKSCRPIIKSDLLAVVQRFYYHRTNNLALLNTTTVVLIPKKEGAEGIEDFQTISLIHGVAKIITKMLPVRLQPYMNSLVSINQSAFIKSKGQSMTTSCMSKTLRVPSIVTGDQPLFIKLDIAKAFDTVRWDYLFDLLCDEDSLKNGVTSLRTYGPHPPQGF